MFPDYDVLHLLYSQDPDSKGWRDLYTPVYHFELYDDFGDGYHVLSVRNRLTGEFVNRWVRKGGFLNENA